MTAPPELRTPVAPALDDDYEDGGFGEPLPVRKRRPFLTKWTAATMALALGGAGFYAGVRIEKHDVGSGGSSIASAFSGAGGTSKSGSRPSGLTGRFPGTSGNETVGSVSSVKGNTVYVKESSGDTVAVKLSKSTKVTKSESVAKGKIYPGDEVVVTGASGSKGVVSATGVTDSGASSTGSASSSTSSSNSGSSAVSSLFGGA